MNEWTRIPAQIDSDTDRRQLAGILTAVGLEVRIVKVKLTEKGTPRKFVEYKEVDQG